MCGKVTYGDPFPFLEYEEETMAREKCVAEGRRRAVEAAVWFARTCRSKANGGILEEGRRSSWLQKDAGIHQGSTGHSGV